MEWSWAALPRMLPACRTASTPACRCERCCQFLLGLLGSFAAVIAAACRPSVSVFLLHPLSAAFAMVLMSVLNACLVTLTNAERRGKRQVLIRPVSKVVVKFLQVMMKHGQNNSKVGTQRASMRQPFEATTADPPWNAAAGTSPPRCDPQQPQQRIFSSSSSIWILSRIAVWKHGAQSFRSQYTMRGCKARSADLKLCRCRVPMLLYSARALQLFADAHCRHGAALFRCGHDLWLLLLRLDILACCFNWLPHSTSAPSQGCSRFAAFSAGDRSLALGSAR